MKMAGAALTGSLVLLMVLSGCGKKQCRVTYVKRVSATPVAVGRAAHSPRVAVLPFRCDESPEAGYTVAAAMAGQLGALDMFTVVDPTVVAARTVSPKGVLSPEEAGEVLNAPYIVSGEVVAYVASPDEGERPAVGVTARMIETATGRVVWTESITQTGSGEWYPEESAGILTARVCGGLAESIGATWADSSLGQGAMTRRSGSIPVPAVEVDDELVPVDDPFAFDREDMEEDSPAISGLIDFPEEAAPEQFGRDFEAEAETAASFPEAEVPEAFEEDTDPETALLPVVPENLPPEHYILPPDEAARFLEMAEDPLPAIPEQAKPVQPVGTAAPVQNAPAPATTVAAAEQEPLPEPVAAAPAEPVQPTWDVQAALPPAVLPALAAEEVASAPELKLPEPVTVVPSPPTASTAEDTTASLPVPVIPAPSEEIVPVNLGVELDEERFPLAKPMVQESMAKPEYGLDDDKDFRSAPSVSTYDAKPVAASEDELDFFGRMSASLEMQLTD